MLYFAADLHLTERIWKSKPELEGDSFRAWERVWLAILADKTKEDKALLIAGDIFDFNKASGEVLRALTWGLNALRQEDVPTYFVQGNHDPGAVPLAEVQGATWLHKQDVLLDGRIVRGLDYMPPEQLKAALLQVPKCDLLLMHAMFAHCVRSEMHADLTADDVPEQIGNILVGDIHIKSLTQFKHRWILSPGTTHPHDIAQMPPHGFWKLGAKDKVPVFCQIAGRGIYRYRLETKDELEAAVAELRALPQQPPELRPLVEFKYTLELLAPVTGFVAGFNDAVFFLHATADGKLGLSADDMTEAREQLDNMSLPGMLPKVLSREKNPGAYDLLERLLAPGANALKIVEEEMATCVQ